MCFDTGMARNKQQETRGCRPQDKREGQVGDHYFLHDENGKEAVFCQYHCPHDAIRYEEPQYDENYNPVEGASRWGVCRDCYVEQEW